MRVTYRSVFRDAHTLHRAANLWVLRAARLALALGVFRTLWLTLTLLWATQLALVLFLAVFWAARPALLRGVLQALVLFLAVLRVLWLALFLVVHRRVLQVVYRWALPCAGLRAEWESPALFCVL